MIKLLITFLILFCGLFYLFSVNINDGDAMIAHVDNTGTQNIIITETNEAISDILDYGEKRCGPFDKNITFVLIDYEENRYDEVYNKLQTLAIEVDAVFNHSAYVNGRGIRHVNFLRDENCNVKLFHVVLPKFLHSIVTTPTLQSTIFNQIDETNEMFNQIFGKNVKPIIIADFSFCGFSTIYPDDSKKDNLNENSVSSMYLNPRCLIYTFVAHEIVHSLGGVQPSAPFAFIGFHCYDQYDIMCGNIRINPFPSCVNRMDFYILIDCNGDSYFNTNVITGYLNTHRNVADSEFLTHE